MEIPSSLIEQLTRQLNSLSEATKKAALDELERLEWTDIADLREKSYEVVNRYLEYSTQIAAQHSADNFDAVRTLAVGEALGAEPVSGYSKEATYGAVKAFVQDVVETGVTGSFFDKCLGRIDYDLKRAAAYATNHNCRKDPLKPKWARVPMGAETCMFCIMLASRGFVYSSENNAGGHWHEHCDCRAIQGYPGMKVKGYDPNKLLGQWYESDHYHYMQRRAKRLADANYIRYEQKLFMKRQGMTKETADILTKHLQEDFKKKYGKDYTEVYRKAQASKYRATLSDGTKIGDFVDVQKFLRDSKSKRDLEHRYSMLVNAYGTKSKMIRSTAMKNAVRHVEKRYTYQSKFSVVSGEKLEVMEKSSDAWFNSMSGNEYASVRSYTRVNGSVDINKHLLGLSDGGSTVKREIKNIDSALKKYDLDENVVAFRGDAAKYYDDWNVGEIRSREAYTSTSLDKEMSQAYIDNVKNNKNMDGIMIEVRVPKGTNCGYIGRNTAITENFEYLENEFEILLARGTKFKVVEKTDNTMVLEVIANE